MIKGADMKRKELMWIFVFVCFALSLFTTDVWATPVPDTGVTKCYNATVEIPCPSPGQPFYGQDGNYTINTPSYTKLDGSGGVLPDSAAAWSMVKDNVTGLIWENKTDDGTIHDKDNTYSWDDSKLIDTLNSVYFGGYSDWRLPTINELVSIVKYSIPSPGPTIDAGYFQNTAASWYWSSTTSVSYNDSAWRVNFGDGFGDYGNKHDNYYVRAVRGGQSVSFDTVGILMDDVSTAAGSYKDNGDGTVTDTSTDLMWQQVSSSFNKTWEQALAYCEGLSLGDYTDWRLPTIKELQSLVDYNRRGPAINTTYFSNTATSWYWSSTTYVGRTTYYLFWGWSGTNFAWCVSFYEGLVLNSPKIEVDDFYVRAVRGGQPRPLDHSVISVSPASRNVAKDTGATTFSVSNTGAGTMSWTAAVISGDTWLSIISGASGTNSGTINCSFTSNTGTSARTATIRVTAVGAYGSPRDGVVTQAGTPITNPIIGSNSIDAVDVVKITDMSGLLPDGGRAVTVMAWDKDGKQLTAAGYASPISIFNHGTTSILGADLEDRFPDGTPAAYTFSVESSKMFITNINNSIDGAVKVPIIYSNGLSNFVSNSVGARNSLKVTDMSGTIASAGTAITITAWNAAGKAIPESTSAAPLKLLSYGTITIAGSSLVERFPSVVPMTYEFTIASPKLVISNVKNSSDGTLNIPTVYTAGLGNFVANTIGPRNTLYISDFSGTLDIGGAAISVRAWDFSGMEIFESTSVSPYKIHSHETVNITGTELASRFLPGSPSTFEFTVGSSNVVITNVKSSSDGSINIPTVYTSGITNYSTNYVSDLNTIKFTDMSGSIPTGVASITITARDMDGKVIPESAGAVALKLDNYGTTTIEGADLQIRFPGGVPVTYEFSIGSSSAVVTNLTKSTDGKINIPTVFTLGPYGGI